MFDIIIPANGKGLRAKVDKLASSLGDSTVLSRTIEAFRGFDCVNRIIVVTDSDYDFCCAIKVSGGNSRAESVKNGLAQCKSEYVLIHDGARPFVSRELITRVMSDTVNYGSSVPFCPITDSLRLVNNDKIITVDRSNYITLQTPQGYVTEEIKFAYENATSDYLFYDESELFSSTIRPVHLTEGETVNKKITNPFDVLGYNMKVGSGFDIHELKNNGKSLTLGGITILHDKGVVAHSDGDVVIHAICDAILNSVNERDIGVLFPDTDSKYKDIDSVFFLTEIKKILYEKNAKINNISVTIIAQKPKLKSYIPLMQNHLAEILGIKRQMININCTTTEHLGLIGKGNAIAVLAVCSIY